MQQLPSGSGARVTREGSEPQPLKLGAWYWVEVTDWEDRERKPARRLCCITQLGSNFAELTVVGSRYGSTVRVHFDTFDTECTPEPNADEIIAREIDRYRRRTHELMDEIRDVTSRLALDTVAEHGGETAALTLSMGATPVEDYKQALVLAKEKTLPDLFAAVEANNKQMGRWMKAQLLPLRAEAERMKPQIERIEGRIFNVELYAGLIESVKQIRDGDPAGREEPVHLMQRRHYMDEECLLDYQTGGMTFNGLGEFDRWIAKKRNMLRLLPHPRCIIAMQIRRFDKELDISLDQYIRLVLSGERELDKKTYLLIRNGEQLYRLWTGIDFGAELFPDAKYARLDGELYGHISGSRCDDIITRGDYETQASEYKRQCQEFDREKAEWKRTVARLKREGVDKKDWPSEPWYYIRDGITSYRPFTPADLYYDEMAAFLRGKMEQHNRVVLVLQGLLDRSAVLHPHPQWRLWHPDEFAKAIVLVHDETRALVGGEAPDFEAYRRRLNESITAGVVTVGQEDFWLRREAEKENARQANDYRIRNASNYKRYRPYGNPGPGVLARVVRGGPKNCVYRWTRERRGPSRWRDDSEMACQLIVPKQEVLNAEAYTPGDYKQFFNDPRTRADYLQWAPLLLECEEYHAGNREVGKSSR